MQSRCARDNPSRSASRVAISADRSMCSAGCPRPRSMATDSAARTSARVGIGRRRADGHLAILRRGRSPGQLDGAQDGHLAMPMRVERVEAAVADHADASLGQPEVAQPCLARAADRPVRGPRPAAPRSSRRPPTRVWVRSGSADRWARCRPAGSCRARASGRRSRLIAASVARLFHAAVGNRVPIAVISLVARGRLDVDAPIQQSLNGNRQRPRRRPADVDVADRRVAPASPS